MKIANIILLFFSAISIASAIFAPKNSIEMSDRVLNVGMGIFAIILYRHGRSIVEKNNLKDNLNAGRDDE